MARDYAKNQRRRSNDRGSGPSGFIWLLMGMLIGLIVAGVFYLKNQTAHPQPLVLPSTATQTNPKQQPQISDENQKPQQTQTNTQSLQTQFDFYNVLPSQKVVGPSGDEDITAISTQNANPISSPTTNPAQPQAQPQTTAQQTPEQILTQQPAQTPKSTALAPVVAATPAPKSTPSPAPSTKPAQYILQIATFSQFTTADQLKAQLTLSGFEVNVSPIQKNGKTLQRVWLGPFQSQAEALAMQKQLQASHVDSKLLKTN